VPITFSIACIIVLDGSKHPIIRECGSILCLGKANKFIAVILAESWPKSAIKPQTKHEDRATLPKSSQQYTKLFVVGLEKTGIGAPSHHVGRRGGMFTLHKIRAR